MESDTERAALRSLGLNEVFGVVRSQRLRGLQTHEVPVTLRERAAGLPGSALAIRRVPGGEPEQTSALADVDRTGGGQGHLWVSSAVH